MKSVFLGVFLAITSFSFANADDLVLNFGADIYMGPPHFKLIVDGKVVLEGDVTDAKEMIFSHSVPKTAGSISISFTNDYAAPEPRKAGEDRNLVINSVQFGGRKINGADLPRGSGTSVRGTSLALGVNQIVKLPFGTGKDTATASDTKPASSDVGNFVVKEIPSGAKPIVEASGGSAGVTLQFVGDSLTAGSGASSRKLAIGPQISALYGDRKFTSIAQGSATSSQINEFFQRKDKTPGAVTVIWVGRNNYTRPDQVKADIKKIVSSLDNKRFVVLSILKGSYENEKPGKSGAIAIDSLNRSLQKEYGSKFLRVGDDIGAADRFDEIHPNDSGYKKVALAVFKNLKEKGW